MSGSSRPATNTNHPPQAPQPSFQRRDHLVARQRHADDPARRPDLTIGLVTRPFARQQLARLAFPAHQGQLLPVRPLLLGQRVQHLVVPGVVEVGSVVAHHAGIALFTQPKAIQSLEEPAPLAAPVQPQRTADHALETSKLVPPRHGEHDHRDVTQQRVKRLADVGATKGTNVLEVVAKRQIDPLHIPIFRPKRRDPSLGIGDHEPVEPLEQRLAMTKSVLWRRNAIHVEPSRQTLQRTEARRHLARQVIGDQPSLIAQMRVAGGFEQPVAGSPSKGEQQGHDDDPSRQQAQHQTALQRLGMAPVGRESERHGSPPYDGAVTTVSD